MPRRAPNMLVVDGNNVPCQERPWHPRGTRARQRLLFDLAALSVGWEARVDVVWDGPPEPPLHHLGCVGGIRTLFSFRRTADDCIVELCARGAPTPIVVATSDRQLGWRSRENGARTISSEALRFALDRVGAQASQGVDAPLFDSPTALLKLGLAHQRGRWPKRRDAVRGIELRDTGGVVVLVLERGARCFVCEERMPAGALARRFRRDIYCLECSGLGEASLERGAPTRPAIAHVYEIDGAAYVPVGVLVDPAAPAGEPRPLPVLPPLAPKLHGKPHLRRPEPDLAKSTDGVLVVVLPRARGCLRCLQEIPRGRLALHGWGGVATCLPCARLADLVYVPRGVALLTRRATKYSTRRAVVAKWVQRYKRYERLGILAEHEAVARARQEVHAAR